MIKVTDDIAARLAEYLDRCATRRRPIRAIDLARACDICPQRCRESRRREVREIIKVMREDGCPIATEGDGYYLATELGDFARYEQFRRRNGLTHLAAEAASKRSDARYEAADQMALFPA